MNRSSSLPNTDQPLGGRYQIVRQLGVGGFGRTYLAEDLHLPGHPICVIKQLKPKKRSDDTLLMARRCFHSEAQALYRLGIHDQIPRLLAHFEDQKEFYLAQEYIEGEPLTHELVEGQPWAEARAVMLLRDILQVLAYVHEQQVIHRDLKPSNLIRRRQDYRIVVIDFGAVKQVSTQEFEPEAGETNLTISIGTQGYMPNEQLAGKPRYSSDLYAIGVIGIQALTGLHPRHLGDDDQGEIAWRQHVPDVHPELATVLDRMVRYDFRERYATASEALEALNQLPIALSEPTTQMQPPAALRQAQFISRDSTGRESDWRDRASGDLPEKLSAPSAADLPVIEEAEATSTALWLPSQIFTEPFNHPVGSESAGASPLASSLPQPTASQTGLTQAIGGKPRPDALDPAQAGDDRTRRRRILPWAIAGLAVTGLLLVLTQPELPSLTQQTIAVDSLPSPSPTATPSPEPIDPKLKAATLMRQADQAMQNESFTDALRLYDQTIRLQPENAEAYAGRCEALNRLDQPEAAIVSCNDALAYQPDYPEAIWSQGNALMLQNRVFEALGYYEQVTALKPEFAPGWVRQGVALQKLGRSAEALVALEQGIRLDRNSAEAWLTKGKAQSDLQRYEQAIVSLDKTLQLQPSSTEAKTLRQAIAKEQQTP